jgi:hypothetical protein
MDHDDMVQGGLDSSWLEENPVSSACGNDNELSGSVTGGEFLG